MSNSYFVLQSADRKFIDTVLLLSYCNPFSKERLELEKKAVGGNFKASEAHWNVYVGSTGELAHVNYIIERLAPLLEQMRVQLLADSNICDPERELYADLILFFLYHRFRTELSRVVEKSLIKGNKVTLSALYEKFDKESRYYLCAHNVFEGSEYSSEHLFALAFQISRAFYHIYHYVIGSSQPMIVLRARIWESIFSVNMRRYRVSFYKRMVDIPTLVTGPSGTGKELVARAVGLARYIPFDKQKRYFVEDFQLSFQALNLSAFAATIIESELFGHKKGAFTGAVSDRQGWLAQTGALGTVFLDEIGELELAIQVKLLRVLESREFQRLGDNLSQHFEGKLIAATNRDLATEIEVGNFRADLFFRLCADKIETPELNARIESDPEELKIMIEHLARRVLEEPEISEFVESSHNWIIKNLGLAYPWPGNVRELEQCLRNLIIHGSYTPIHSGQQNNSKWQEVSTQMQQGRITLADLTSQYLTHVYKITGTFEETGRRVGLDRRTVKIKLMQT